MRSSNESFGLATAFFSSARRAAYFLTSFARLVSRSTIEVFAISVSCPYQLRNGKLKASSSALASSLVPALVVMAISIPRSASTWS